MQRLRVRLVAAAENPADGPLIQPARSATWRTDNPPAAIRRNRFSRA